MSPGGPPRTVADALAHAARAFADRPAVKAGDTLSYATLWRDAAATARAIDAHPASTLGIYCRDPIRFVVALYGAILSGRLAFLIAGEAERADAARIVDYFGIEALVTDDTDPAAPVPTIAPARNDEADDGATMLDDIKADDYAIALLTSGTTGKRRAVPATHRNLMWTGRAYNDVLGLTDGHRELVMVPLTHSLGVRQLFALLLVGGCLVPLPGPFNPAKALVTLRDEDCDMICAVPTQIRTMLGGRFRRDLAAIGPQIRHVELSSSPMHADEKSDLVSLLPNAEINLGYGLTEATRSSHLSLNRDTAHLDSAGKPGFPGVEITIRDEDGTILASGDVGEIVVTGGNVAEAYIIGREWVREPFEGGSFHTGDLGYLDGEGFLHVVGRKDDMINIGGRKLHPTEVERVLHEAFPDLDCAISQRPHPVLGARPVLCLGDADADAESILGLLRQACDAYKVPGEVVRLEAIPRTANGKIIRSELARSVISQAAAEADEACPSPAP